MYDKIGEHLGSSYAPDDPLPAEVPQCRGALCDAPAATQMGYCNPCQERYDDARWAR